MRIRAAAILICFAVFLAQAAQGPLQRVSFRNDTLSVDVNRVNVLLTVENHKGRLIRNLAKGDFRVFEDDQLQDISNFSSETDLPLNIAFLIDTSGSIRDKIRFERQAAAKFFCSALRSGKDKALVMGFDTRPAILQDFTDDAALLTTAVQKIIPGGSTSMYDAVFQVTGRRLAELPGRRVIVILSDGLDNSSNVSLAQVLEFAQRNNVVLYAVSTNHFEGGDTADQRRGDANLRVLAEQTGGGVLFPQRLEDLSHAFARINEELRSQYSLAYGPTNKKADGTYRRIRIVASHKSYIVRSRNGYYAPESGKSRSAGPS